MTRSCSAIIFDFDGVLVDSNPIAERHWAKWAQLHGIPEEAVLSIHHGLPTIETIRAVAPHLDIAAEARRKERAEADDTEGLVRYPGVLALISRLPDAGWGIATSGTRRTATYRMGVVGIPLPRVLVTADDVKRGKPDPEPYLLAADKLGVPIRECVVFEDAPAGVRSAKAAGAYVIGISSTNNAAALAEADIIISSLMDVAVEADRSIQLKITR